MSRFFKNRKSRLLTVTILIPPLLLLTSLLSRWESKILDVGFKLRNALPFRDRGLDSRIILITVGDKAAKEMGGWPITRDYYAYLLHILKEWGVKAIGFHIFFGDRERVYTENDSLFAHFCQKAGNVYQAFFFHSLTGRDSLSSPSHLQIPDRFGIPLPPDYNFDFLIGVKPSLPIEALQKSCKGIGHIHVVQDKDGIVRKAPLFIQYGKRLFPSLGLALACEALSVKLSRISFTSGNHIELNTKGKIIRIPVDRRGQVSINYTTTPDKLPIISILQVFESYRQRDKDFAAAFRNKIVLITASVSGVPTLLPTPVSPTYPSAGIQAQLIDNFLRQNFLHRSSFPVRAVLVLTLGFLIGLWPVTNRLGTQLFFAGLLLGIYILLAAALFFFFNLWVGIIAPALTIVACTLVTALWQEKRKFEAIESKRTELETAHARVEKEKQALELKLNQKVKELETIQKELESFRRRELLGETIPEEIGLKRETLMRKYPALRAIANERIIGKSAAIVKVLEDIVLCASTDEPVLIRGATGTGKSLVAEAIHLLSSRGAAKGRMMTFNCARFEAGDPRVLLGELFGYGPHHGIANLPKNGQDGILKEADGGTVFLDEVGDLPPQGQNLLLGPLDGKEFYPAIGERIPIRSNIRFIFATNKNLEDLVEKGLFRQDLLSRIKIFQIRIPSLQERKEDIELLATHFLRKENSKYNGTIAGFSAKVMHTFRDYTWPDNVRGLENAIKFAAAKARLEGSNIIRSTHLPEELQSFVNKASTWRETNSEDILLSTLRKRGFNIVETARELRKNRDTVTQRFKGICFVALYKNNWILRNAAEAIAGDQKELTVKVETKMREYMKSIFAVTKTHPDRAKDYCLKRNRKLPQRYHWALEKVIEACLEGKVTL